MNYSTEQIKQKYWNIYIDKVSDYIVKHVDNPQKFKIKQKILSFNTYLIGLSKKQINVFQPTKTIIFKHSGVFHEDLIHNYQNMTKTTFKDILNYMLETRERLNELEKIELKKKIDIHKVIKTNKDSMIELTIDDKTYSLYSTDYKRLTNMYSNKDIPVNYAICTLLLRYEYYGPSLQGICLSADLVYKWIKKYRYENVSLELFAGSLNSNLPNYCSLFYDIEKYFGSKGSVFLYKDICDYGILVSNPPFLTNVMNLSAKIILKYLKNSSKKSNMVLINIPDWRSSTQYNRDDTTLSHTKINEISQSRQDGEYKNYEILRNSPYFRRTLLFGNFRYKNFFGKHYATIRDNILIIILTTSADDPRIQSFIDFSSLNK